MVGTLKKKLKCEDERVVWEEVEFESVKNTKYAKKIVILVTCNLFK